MKTYKIKQEFFDLWGEDTTIDTVLTRDEAEMIAKGWDKTFEDIENQLIECSDNCED